MLDNFLCTVRSNEHVVMLSSFVFVLAVVVVVICFLLLLKTQKPMVVPGTPGVVGCRGRRRGVSVVVVVASVSVCPGVGVSVCVLFCFPWTGAHGLEADGVREPKEAECGPTPCSPAARRCDALPIL